MFQFASRPYRLSPLPVLISCALLLVMALGCVGELSTPVVPAESDAGALDESAELRALFDEEVAPLLNSYCGGCHGAATSVPFLASGADSYDSVLQWPNLVNLRVPAASGLLSKGAHMGPAWQADQAMTVRSWIDEEARLSPEDVGALETAAILPIAGENTIALDGVGLAGASISFRMEPLASGMYLSRLSLNATGQGVRIVHPTFVPWDGDRPRADPVDRFSNVDIVAEAGGSVSVGGGTLILVDVPSTSPLSIRFEVAEVAQGGGGVLAGCLDVAAFTANAQPLLAQNCASCHAGGDAGAANAVDMTRLADLSVEGQAAACGQILSRVNLLDPNNSSIFLAPEPQSALGHPFKLPDNTSFLAFRSALLVWVSAEQVATPNN